MNFAQLFQLINRHKWLLLVVVTLSTTATYLGVRLKGTQYEATSTLMPQEQALQTVDAQGNNLSEPQAQKPSEAIRRARAESLVALALSPRVLGPVAARLGLPLSTVEMQKIVQLKVVTPEVLQVNATAGTPDVAGDLANAVASTFVQFYSEMSTNTINESIRQLTAQETKAGKDVERTKMAVQKYKALHNISQLSDQLSGVNGRLNSIRQSREATSAELAELSATLNQVQVQIAKTPPIVRIVDKSNDSPAAQTLRTEIGILEKDLALERANRTELHPRVQELKAKLMSAQRRLDQEEGRLIEHVRLITNADYTTIIQRRRDLEQKRDGLMAKLKDFRKSVGDLEAEMQTYTGADVQLAALMQRYTLADQRYTSLTIRLRQAEATADSIRSQSAITIVDTAGPMNPPVDVSKGKLTKLTVAAFILSLALVIFILAAWDYLDQRVRTSADAESLVELPIAGIIPRSLSANSPSQSQLAALMPASPEGEAYRFLSLHLLLMRDDNPVRVLMMATSKPGQGATTTLSNLAVTLAQGNRRVILVDADMRRPMLHTMFDASNEVGLTTVLAEGLPVERALQATAIPNLALLPSGPMHDNPWVLLRSSAMEGLVRRLRQMADFILIDTPSASAFADAFNVAPHADGAFMVVRSRHQPTGIEARIKQMLEDAGVKVMGTILNGVPIKDVETCRNHTEFYGNARRLSGHNSVKALPAGKP